MSKPLQFLTSGYTQESKLPALTAPTGKQINLYAVNACNQSGSTIDLAVGILESNSTWKLYTYTVANTPTGTDYTSAIQGGGSVNIFDTTTNDGFIVGCQNPFNIIGLTLAQAQSGSPVYSYQYYNGSSWATLTTLAVGGYGSTGDTLIVFAAPQDWVTGADAGAGVAAGYYYIRVRATTAPGQDVQANAAWVVSFLQYAPQVDNYGSVSFRVFDSALPITLDAGAGVIPYFGGSNAKNTCSVVYSLV